MASFLCPPPASFIFHDFPLILIKLRSAGENSCVIKALDAGPQHILLTGDKRERADHSGHLMTEKKLLFYIFYYRLV